MHISLDEQTSKENGVNALNFLQEFENIDEKKSESDKQSNSDRNSENSDNEESKDEIYKKRGSSPQFHRKVSSLVFFF